MSKVEEIHAAIEELTLEERTELAGEFPDDQWDWQMKNAARDGKFDALNAETDATVQNRRCIPLDSRPSQ
jgi:hypothetical protein